MKIMEDLKSNLSCMHPENLISAILYWQMTYNLMMMPNSFVFYPIMNEGFLRYGACTFQLWIELHLQVLPLISILLAFIYYTSISHMHDICVLDAYIICVALEVVALFEIFFFR